MTRAFELVLKCCAVYEPISGEFWDQYLGFLESWNPVNKWEEQSRVDMIRKLFRVMLCVPFDALESMWARYTAWEQEVNGLTARKFIGEISAGYMRARSLFKEWSVLVGGDAGGLKRVVPVSLRACNKNTVPSNSNSNSNSVQGYTFDVQQLEVWRRWLSWERENKLELDSKALRLRLEYVYKQAVQYMVFCPEMWYEYSTFCGSGDGHNNNEDSTDNDNSAALGMTTAGDGINSNNNSNNNNNNSNSSSSVNNIISYSSNSSTGGDGSSTIDLPTGPARSTVLEVGLRANPMSGILTLKLAECYEFANVEDKVSEVFETTLGAILARVQLLNERLAQETLETSQSADNEDKDTDPQRVRLELQSLKERMTFIYCVYMNTVMKLSGLSAARAVFSKCRKLKHNLTHAIYLENAYLEFQNQTDGYRTAFKVLELGLKYFQSNGEYINKYLDFLMLLNRDSQIKTLFESSVDKVQDPKQLKSIFMKMIQYETKFGSVANVYSLERRFIQKFPGELPIDVFSERYSIQHSNVFKRLELGYRLTPYGDGNEGGDDYEEEDDDDDDYRPRDSNPTGRKRRRNDRNGSPDVEDDRGRRVKRGTGSSGGAGAGAGASISQQNKKNLADAVPQPIVDLLKILPKRQYFKDAILDPENLVEYLINQVEVPMDTKE